MANTTNFNWETPDDTDLVKDGAAAIRTLGSAIDTSLVDLKGGTTGQVLSKATNTDMDFTWVTSDDANAIQNAIVDAKGDLIAASAADVPARLAVGTNGHVLIADSAQTTGLKWGVDPTTDVVTTAGDLIYGTAADTVTRLGIGTAGQVLTVNSGATAPQWSSPASSGGMTLLQSLSLSGSSVTSSTLSSAYKQFVVYFKGASVASGNQYLNFRLNGDTGSNYGWTYLLYNATDAVGISVGSTDTKCRMGLVDVVGTDYGVMKGILTIMRPSDTDYIFWNFDGWNRNTIGTNSNQYSVSAGTYDSSAAITSITFYPDASTFDGGTAEIYGVN